MVILEIEAVEVDHCLQCKGLWLDAGEIELLMEMAKAETGPLTRAIARGGTKSAQKRRCPVCGKRMLEAPIGEAAMFVIDRCPRGHGLWLDDREIDRLLEFCGATAQSEALARLLGRALQHQRKQPEAGSNP
jgi:hypothetical protein